MSTPILYQVSVPVLISQLNSLRVIVKQGDESCKAGKNEEKKLVESRLTPEMLPFAFQIQTACNITKLLGRIAPVAPPTAIPASSDDPKDMLGWKSETFAELDSRMAITLEYLQSLDPKVFEGKENEAVEFFHFKFDNALDFVHNFMFANFFFHKTTAYDLLKIAGVELSKSHYLGLATII